MKKSFALAITHIYPSLQPFVDFHVIEEGGVQSIASWNNSNPQPTSNQMDAAWFEVYKQLKKDELSLQCQQAISGGFSSSALGVAHTYPSDEEAQRNFNTTMNRFQTDPNYTTAPFKTLDSGYQNHTKTQFFQVFADGHNFGFSQIQHLNDLKAKLDALTYPTNTEADIDAITW